MADASEVETRLPRAMSFEVRAHSSLRTRHRAMTSLLVDYPSPYLPLSMDCFSFATTYISLRNVFTDKDGRIDCFHHSTYWSRAVNPVSTH